MLWQEPCGGCQAAAERPGPVHGARGPLLRPRAALPAPHSHARPWYQRVLLRPEARRAPAQRHLQLLSYRQGDPAADGVREHCALWSYCPGARVRRELQRAARDVRYGWSGLLQLNRLAW